MGDAKMHRIKAWVNHAREDKPKMLVEITVNDNDVGAGVHRARYALVAAMEELRFVPYENKGEYEFRYEVFPILGAGGKV
jgi:hypothetical protein